jgi:hypothetical protein
MFGLDAAVDFPTPPFIPSAENTWCSSFQTSRKRFTMGPAVPNHRDSCDCMSITSSNPIMISCVVVICLPSQGRKRADNIGAILLVLMLTNMHSRHTKTACSGAQERCIFSCRKEPATTRPFWTNLCQVMSTDYTFLVWFILPDHPWWEA